MKKENFLMMSLVVVSLFFGACGSNTAQTAKEDQVEAKQVDGDTNTVNTTAASLKDDKLNAVYQHYVHLTNALVNSDATEAKVAVNAIALGAEKLTNGNELVALAKKIGDAKDIDAQRTLYADLSNNFIARVKDAGLTNGELYVAYCPMALNDKGAVWLSTQKEIRNPYFGESMMTCGEVKETLN